MKYIELKAVPSKDSKKNLNLLTLNTKQFLYCFVFLNNFKTMLKKKGVYVCDTLLNVSESKLYITLHLFIQNFKCAIYKKKSNEKKKIVFQNKYKVINKKLYSLFTFYLNILKLNSIFLNIKILNKNINRRISIKLYHKLKNFINILFNRRFNLFIDFIRINALFIETKISIKIYIFFLGQIFKFLLKRRHNRYISFLKLVFQEIINMSKIKSLKLIKSIKGLKSVLKGRLQGKPRASSSIIQKGKTPIQSIEKNIDFSKIHIYTLYGVFGLRIWVYFF